MKNKRSDSELIDVDTGEFIKSLRDKGLLRERKDRTSKKRHVFPWDNVSFKKGGKGNCCTVSADVWLGDTDGNFAWHTISFTMDETGFEKLAYLGKDRLRDLLEALAIMPINNSLLMHKKKSRGRNNAMSLSYWSTARYLANILLKGFRLHKNQFQGIKKEIMPRMEREEGLQYTSLKGITAYLIKLNWKNIYNELPEEFISHFHDPDGFFKILKRGNSRKQNLEFVSPEQLNEVVSNILKNNKHYILSHSIEENSISMPLF